MTKKTQKEAKVNALVLHETALAPRQQTAIAVATPAMFIKNKPGRGGKSVSYVETGYVVSRLNEVFSPAGWNFEIEAQGESTRKTEKRAEGEVWVRGKLTIVDHKNDYRVSKTQYGQHPVHENVPIGDAFKSAASDCLKKCASLFGIAHDVYWKIAEAEGGNGAPMDDKKPEKKTKIDEQDMVKIRAIIKSTKSNDALFQIDGKIQESKIYTEKQKMELHGLISNKVDENDNKQ